MAIDVHTARVSTLPLPIERVWDVSPAGADTLIVDASIGHAARLFRASTSSPQRLERLPLPVVSQFVVSGAYLAYSQPQLRGLTVCRLPALDCTRIDVPIDDANRFEWTITPRAVWYVQGLELVRHDLAGGGETRRMLQGTAPLGTISIAADERIALESREDRAEVDLMIASARQAGRSAPVGELSQKIEDLAHRRP